MGKYLFKVNNKNTRIAYTSFFLASLLLIRGNICTLGLICTFLANKRVFKSTVKLLKSLIKFVQIKGESNCYSFIDDIQVFLLLTSHFTHGFGLCKTCLKHNVIGLVQFVLSRIYTHLHINLCINLCI